MPLRAKWRWPFLLVGLRCFWEPFFVSPPTAQDLSRVLAFIGAVMTAGYGLVCGQPNTASGRTVRLPVSCRSTT